MMPLSEVSAGRWARVVALRSSDPARLDRLGAFGLVPGSLVWVAQKAPSVIFRVGETEIAVDGAVAREIIVEPN